MKKSWGIGCALLCMGALLTTRTEAGTQSPPPDFLTLSQAIDYALEHYPSVQESLAKHKEAQSGIDLAETNYLPRVEIGVQGTRSTFNNVSGMFFPNSFLQPISGPDLGRNSYSSSWGSAAGVLLAWEPFDFGLRSAQVSTAQTMERHSQAFITLTQLEVALAVGDAYIDVMMAQASRQALQSNLDRRVIFAKTVDVLVRNQLRAGVDGSRAQAETAVAQTHLLEAEQVERSRMATLSQVLGLAGTQISIKDPILSSSPQGSVSDKKDPAQHPLALVQKAAADIPKKREEALASTWAPKFNLQSAFFGRGSGWDNQGTRGGGGDGLLPDVPNWSVGLTATFSLMEFSTIRAQKQQEHYRNLAEMARYDRVIQELTAQQVKAHSLMESTKRIAENTPIQLQAARLTESQAAAQFKAGLATVVDVAEAQRLVVQAEVDDARARLGVWKALLAFSGVQGELSEFLRLARSSPSPPDSK
ncbi:TolC family protein [uncultured Nitrospira sp.]|uniref:TolC family protein n=1 Tax=uncultured Nitrospira sp. TaxID=157176 RepID=UPI00313FEFD4